MKGKGETGSETESRTFKLRGWKPPRVARDRWWAAPLALLVVAAILATSVVLLTEAPGSFRRSGRRSTSPSGRIRSRQQLNITFARVSYLDQPTQWNTTGFLNASLTANGAWLDNTSSYGTHYGIAPGQLDLDRDHGARQLASRLPPSARTSATPSSTSASR